MPLIDGFEGLRGFLRDVHSRNLVAFSRELVHVNPLSVDVPGSLGDDSGIMERLDQHTEDIGVVGHVRSSVLVGESFHDGRSDPLPIKTELLVDGLLLLGIDEIEEEDLEALGRPVLYGFVFFFREFWNGLVGPDFPEFMVRGFVRHGESDHVSQRGVQGISLDHAKCPHGEALNEKLHADEFLVDHTRLNNLTEQVPQGGP